MPAKNAGDKNLSIEPTRGHGGSWITWQTEVHIPKA